MALTQYLEYKSSNGLRIRQATDDIEEHRRREAWRWWQEMIAYLISPVPVKAMVLASLLFCTWSDSTTRYLDCGP